jgi:hypothetical protein
MSDVGPAAPAADVDVISTINKLKQLATCDVSAPADLSVHQKQTLATLPLAVLCVICQVADALRTFSVPHGGFVPGLTMFSPRLRSREDGEGEGEGEGDETTLVGPVWVVKFVDKDDVDAPRLEGHYVSVFFLRKLRDWTQHRPNCLLLRRRREHRSTGHRRTTSYSSPRRQARPRSSLTRSMAV